MSEYQAQKKDKMMIDVDFHALDKIADEKLIFAVIAAKYDGQWIFCRHKARDTWEIPGGHREAGEDILQTAKRELIEETGAVSFDLESICVYRVTKDHTDSYGLLCKANVKLLGELSDESEIGEISFFEEIPDALTYPAIQPGLFAMVRLMEMKNDDFPEDDF